MNGDRPALFRGRHFADDVIILCVGWYLRYSLSYRDLAEMMTERNLSVDPSTIWRWVQRYAPELNARIRRELKPTNGSWRTDETYVRVAGRWNYLYRAVDSTGATIDFFLSETRDVFAARTFFRKALAAPSHVVAVRPAKFIHRVAQAIRDLRKTPDPAPGVAGQRNGGTRCGVAYA